MTTLLAETTAPELLADAFLRERVFVEAWYDEVTDQLGHDARSAYVERFWLGILGPSATWLLRWTLLKRMIRLALRVAYRVELEGLENIETAGKTIPANTRKHRKLDRDVFEYAYKVIEQTLNQKIDAARGIYVPTDGTKRIWDGSWISRETHIQICVRNQANLLGTWLQYPHQLEAHDVCQTLCPDRAALVGSKNPEGSSTLSQDAENAKD